MPMKRLLLAILSIAMMAATPPRPLDLPHSSETIDVSIVNLDAFVTDRRGNRVHGLTRDDFEIFEDSKTQPITNFTEYASDIENGNASVSGVEPAVTRNGTAVPPPRQQRTIIVFIDQGVGGKQIFTKLKQLLHRAVRPGDAVTILFWGKGIYMRQQFTDDLQMVDRMVDSMSGEPHPEFSGQEQIERERRWAQSIARRSPGLSVADDFPDDQGIDAAFRQMRAKTHAINAVLQSVSAVDGQKIMLLLTPRFSMFADGKTSRGAFSVYLALGDSLGVVGDVTQRSQPFVTSDIQHAKDGLFQYEFGLLTDGRISRIAVGVYDEVTREYGLQRIDLLLPTSR